jgi:hypothetical protein
MRTAQQVKASIKWLQCELEKEQEALRNIESGAASATLESPDQHNGVAKTGWHEGNTNPGGPGVYERDYSGTMEPFKTAFSYFSGADWYLTHEAPEGAVRAHTISTHQDLPWRGLIAQ